MFFKSLVQASLLIAMLLGLLVGCRTTDPYCQTAIANLRAEKIQLENEYYALKSLYETDMARLGQPVNLPGWSTPINPTISDGEIIYEEIIPTPTPQLAPPTQRDPSSAPSLDAPTLAPPQTGLDQQQVVDLATHIRSIEVSQLPPANSNFFRLLVRPLDQQGAVLPLTGDIKLRTYDSTTKASIFEREFSLAEVRAWVRDQPGQQPGIHLTIPLGQIQAGNSIWCDLQYRTADQRILKGSTQLVLGNATHLQARVSSPFRNSSTKSNIDANATGPGQVSRPFQPENIQGTIDIEIGEELNFDSIPETQPGRPRWSPDR